MRGRLPLLGAGVAALVYGFRRWRRPDDSEERWSGEADLQPPDPSVVDAPASEMDPARREQESELTETTRYEREVERESEQRQDAAEPLKDDPLTRDPE